MILTVRSGNINLQTRCQRDRAKRAMRRQRNVVDLRQRRNPMQLADTPTMRHLGTHEPLPSAQLHIHTYIRLRDVNRAALEVRPEVVARVQALAERDRRRDRVREVRDLVGLRRQQRLLDEERLQRLEELRELARHALVQAPVEVDADVEPERAHAAHARERVGEHVRGREPVDGACGARSAEGAEGREERTGGVHLDGGEALRLARRGAVEHGLRVVAADPGVHLHALAHAAAEQLPHGHAERPALDVPQCDVQAGQGRLRCAIRDDLWMDGKVTHHEHGPAAVEARAVGVLPDVLDPSAVPAEECLAEGSQRAFYRFSMACEKAEVQELAQYVHAIDPPSNELSPQPTMPPSVSTRTKIHRGGRRKICTGACKSAYVSAYGTEAAHLEIRDFARRQRGHGDDSSDVSARIPGGERYMGTRGPLFAGPDQLLRRADRRR